MCLQKLGAGGVGARVHCLFDEWGYIVGHTSWGHNFNFAAFGLPTDGRNLSGLPLGQKIKKSPSLAVRVGGPISYRGDEGPAGGKKASFFLFRAVVLAN